MSGFNWGGAAGGVLEEARRQRQDAQAAAEHELRKQALMAQLAGQDDARHERKAAGERAAEERRIDNARIVTGLLTPGEIPAEQAGRLKNTPYDALLEQKTTLPSRTLPEAGGANLSDPGGQAFNLFTGTPEQRQQAGQRTAREQLLKDPMTPAMVGRLVRFREAGINLANPESLRTAQEIEAAEAADREGDFKDFERRERLQASLRPKAGVRVGTLVTTKDRLQARRWAQQDAADRYDALKDANGFVPDGVTLDRLVADLEEQYLSELDPSHRPSAPKVAPQAAAALGQVFPGGRAFGSRETPQAGPALGGNTITRAELRATAQRLGMSEQQAAAEAQRRGLVVR